jgi:prepilin-type processing-associated H-X9-DG protein
MVIDAGKDYAVPWMTPTDAGESKVMSLGPNMSFQHPGGINACFVDGSVRFLKSTISAKLLRALMSASGNDPVSDDQY